MTWPGTRAKADFQEGNRYRGAGKQMPAGIGELWHGQEQATRLKEAASSCSAWPFDSSRRVYLDFSLILSLVVCLPAEAQPSSASHIVSALTPRLPLQLIAAYQIGAVTRIDIQASPLVNNRPRCRFVPFSTLTRPCQIKTLQRFLSTDDPGFGLPRPHKR